MIFPSKYEDLNKSIVIIGASILKMLKKKKSLSIEGVYEKIKNENGITIERFYDVLTFLWLSEIIIVNEYSITKRK